MRDDVDGDLSKAFEEISKLKGMLNGDLKKNLKPKSCITNKVIDQIDCKPHGGTPET